MQVHSQEHYNKCKDGKVSLILLTTCLQTNSTQRSIPMPRPDVQYQPPDVCTGVTSGQLAPMCLKDGDDANISGTPPVASASLLLVTGVALLLGVVAM